MGGHNQHHYSLHLSMIKHLSVHFVVCYASSKSWADDVRGTVY